MQNRLTTLLLLILALALTVPALAQDDAALVIDDFETDLMLAQDAYGNNIGHVPWGDTDGNVTLAVTEVAPDSEMALPEQDATTGVLAVTYDIAGYGGFTHVFNDGENWTTQDWTAYNALQFWLYGNETGGTIQVEIFDNRNPDETGDTAERFFFQVTNDYAGWLHITIPFSEFQRRSDWQPGGALDDGFGLTEVSGYAFGFPAGTGTQTAYLEQVQLVTLEDVAVVDEPVTEEAPDEVTVEPVSDQVAGEIMTLDVVIDDFESGLPVGMDADGNGIGLIPWGDTPENVVLSARQLIAFSASAVPGMEAMPNTVLAVSYDIGGWGGFTHALTDGVNWLSADWTAANALSLWLRGTDTGGIIQVEIFDNRNPDQTGDSAERWFYQITDDFTEWQQFTIPFAMFQRRTDWQPNGAPDDGLGLNEVSGYAIGFPVGAGPQVALIDQVGLATVEDTSVVSVAGAASEEAFVVDESIDWDSREWELIWSDEFEGEVGTPINDEFWTCEIGGWGWGNNELEYYTDRTENVSLDGNGALAIVARQENPEGYECHYGECEYTSARCITMDKMEFTYGRVEARIRIPYGQGIWPAFWMLGADFPEVGWPDSGEIDILENVGYEPQTVHGTLHGPGYSGANGLGGGYSISEDFSDDFHVFAIDWEPNVIRWYVDGVLYNTISVNDVGGREWVYAHDFFLLLNVAVGGHWPGYPDETTEFPQTMLVDYVRVYQLATD